MLLGSSVEATCVCSVAGCNTFDFLPVRCRVCRAPYCTEHISSSRLDGCVRCLARRRDAPLPNSGRTTMRPPPPKCCYLCGVPRRDILACSDCERLFCVAHRHDHHRNCVATLAALAPRPGAPAAPAVSHSASARQFTRSVLARFLTALDLAKCHPSAAFALFSFLALACLPYFQ